MKSYLLLFLTVIRGASAFVPASKSRAVSPLRIDEQQSLDSQLSFTTLFAEKKKKGGLDESMRNKLVTESIAPWRTLRLFVYGSFGSGAFIGGLINGSGAIAAMNSPEFNLQTEVRKKADNFTAQKGWHACCRNEQILRRISVNPCFHELSNKLQSMLIVLTLHTSKF